MEYVRGLGDTTPVIDIPTFDVIPTPAPANITTEQSALSPAPELQKAGIILPDLAKGGTISNIIPSTTPPAINATNVSSYLTYGLIAAGVATMGMILIKVSKKHKQYGGKSWTA